VSPRAPVLAALVALGCRRDVPDPSVLVYDGAGLPDCAASYSNYDICTAIRPWRSSVPEGYAEPTWLTTPVRWIGTEESPSFCTDDAAEAEAWVLAYEPLVDGGTVTTNASNPNWFDVIRFDAEHVALERQRIVRCDFLSALDVTPPGLDPVPDYATYAAPPVADEDFFPVMREIAKWRQTNLTFQSILSWGEVRTETLHLRTCNVRCGVCEDPTGGRLRDVTGVLEQGDWTADPVTGAVAFEPTAILEVDCYASF
jgi:hypothetical protein